MPHFGVVPHSVYGCGVIFCVVNWCASLCYARIAMCCVMLGTEIEGVELELSENVFDLFVVLTCPVVTERCFFAVNFLGALFAVKCFGP